MHGVWSRWVALASVTGILSLCACNSDRDTGDSGEDGADGAINVDGVYSGTRSNSGGSATITFNFNQSAGMLTGSFNDSSLGNGVVSGSITGDDLEFSTVLTSGNIVIEWIGQVEADGAAISGTWSVTVGGSADGEWSVAR